MSLICELNGPNLNLLGKRLAETNGTRTSAEIGQDCVWGSVRPFLRAQEQVEYGCLIDLFAKLFPYPVNQRAILWDTPYRLFGFVPQNGPTPGLA